jgi:hypothetical protein
MSLVFGKRHHGRHRRWILVMVPIDVTDFDDGRRGRMNSLSLVGLVLFATVTSRTTVTYAPRYCLQSTAMTVFILTVGPTVLVHTGYKSYAVHTSWSQGPRTYPTGYYYWNQSTEIPSTSSNESTFARLPGLLLKKPTLFVEGSDWTQCSHI